MRTAVTRTSVSRSAASRTAATAKTNRFLAIGDSLTLGSVGGSLISPLTDRWIDQLTSAASGDTLTSLHGGTWEVTTASVSGATSTGIVNASGSWVHIAPYADLISIFLGVNDGAGLSAGDTTTACATYNDNITTIVNAITASSRIATTNIMLFGMPPHGSNGKSYLGAAETQWEMWNTQIEATATALGLTFVPMYDVYDPGIGQYNPGPVHHSLPEDPSNLISDTDATYTHPNAAGYAMFYARALAYLPDNLLAHKLTRATV